MSSNKIKDDKIIEDFMNSWKIWGAKKIASEEDIKKIRTLKTIETKVTKYLPHYRDFNEQYKKDSKEKKQHKFKINNKELTNDEKKVIDELLKEHSQLFAINKETDESMLFNIIKYGTQCLEKASFRPMKPIVTKAMDYLYYYPKITEYVGKKLEELVKYVEKYDNVFIIPDNTKEFLEKNPDLKGKYSSMNRQILEQDKTLKGNYTAEKLFNIPFIIENHKNDDEKITLKGFYNDIKYEVVLDDLNAFESEKYKDDFTKICNGIITYSLSNNNIKRQNCKELGFACVCDDTMCDQKKKDFNNELNKRNIIICSLLIGANNFYNENKTISPDIMNKIQDEFKINKICGKCIKDKQKLDMSAPTPAPTTSTPATNTMSEKELKEFEQFKDFRKDMCEPELTDYKNQTEFEFKEMAKATGDIRTRLNECEKKPQTRISKIGNFFRGNKPPQGGKKNLTKRKSKNKKFTRRKKTKHYKKTRSKKNKR